MSNPFVAEIRIFAGNFAPTGWATCDGQILPISQNTALFALLGTMFGGNGTSNFGLPNLQGNAPMHAGQGPGLSQRFPGESGGEPTVTLQQTQMPSHAHTLQGSTAFGANTNPANGFLAHSRWFDSNANRGAVALYNTPNNPQPNPTPVIPMNPVSTTPNGSGQPHNNMMPFLGLTFIIALQGIFPPRG
jgi:microcystin-dependent protein